MEPRQQGCRHPAPLRAWDRHATIQLLPPHTDLWQRSPAGERLVAIIQPAKERGHA